MSNFGVTTDQLIYRGIWTNWSHGKVLGSTLTLTQRDGNLLVAFLALFVAYAGTSFFHLACFVLHYVFSSRNTPGKSRKKSWEASHHALYHQRQALLRNSSGPTEGLVGSITLLWQWRRSRQKAVKQVLPLAMLSAILLSGFAIAGVYSSQIAAFSGTEVLISSDSCALRLLPQRQPTLTEYADIWTPYVAQRMNAFLTYAQDCYSNENSTNDDNCKIFVKPRLPKTIDRNAPCPFRDDICKSSNGNIRMDTGFLDTHWDLGFNAPESHRMLFREVVHCAPLVVDGHSDVTTVSIDGLAMPNQRYFYGPTMSIEGYKESRPTYKNVMTGKDMIKYRSGSADYSIWSAYSKAFNGSISKEDSFWWPIPALERNDSDTTLLFLLSDNIQYSGQVNDPWFSAHQDAGEVHYQSFDPAVVNTYHSDYAASPLACAVQYQLCPPPNPSSKRCTALGSFMDMMENTPEQTRNETDWFIKAALRTRPFNNILDLGGALFAAKYTLSDGMNIALPDNQWQIEMERLFNVLLAAMQGAAVETASEPVGPLKELVLPFNPRPDSDVQRMLCKSQKVRSTAHQNFSVLGLALTLAIGLLSMLSSWILDCVYVDRIWKSPRFNQYPRLEWISNGTLQLQRLAFERLGYEEWENCDGAVPTTDLEHNLGVLDLEDVTHPRLRKAPIERNERESMGKNRSAEFVETVSSFEESGNGVNEKMADSVRVLEKRETFDSGSDPGDLSAKDQTMYKGVGRY